jgi:WD40 repeat protein
VKIWDAQTGKELLFLKGHTGPVVSVAFGPKGKRLASTDWGDTKVWDAQTGQELLSIKGSGESVAFSRHSRQRGLQPGWQTPGQRFL